MVFDYFNLLFLFKFIIIIFACVGCGSNGYIIDWMLHLIFMHSKKVVISILPIHPLYLISSPFTGWSNCPINKVHISNLNCRQIFPCQYVHASYIHSGCMCEKSASKTMQCELSTSKILGMQIVITFVFSIDFFTS